MRLFPYLRMQMAAQDVSSRYLARELRLSESQMSNLLAGKCVWTLDKMWAVMDLLSLPPEDLGKCFPAGGKQKVTQYQVVEVTPA